MIKILVLLVARMHAYLYISIYRLFKLNYKTVAICISRYPGRYGILIRRVFYEKTLRKCGEDLSVFYGAYIVYPEVEVGSNCAIEEYSIVSLCSIGDDVILAARVSIMSGSHHHDVSDVHSVFRESKSYAKRVYIGNNVWIGTHAVVMEDIASDTAVGAGAIVTKKFQPYLVIAGMPAKPIRNRLSNS